MRAGALRHFGMLQERSTVKDEYGGQVTDWINVGRVRFMLAPAGGHEIEFGGSTRVQAMFKLTMRYRKGIKPTMRILEFALPEQDERIFNITNIDDIEGRRRQIDLTVIQGVSVGES